MNLEGEFQVEVICNTLVINIVSNIRMSVSQNLMSLILRWPP